MYFGSVAANKKFFDGLPKEVQEAFVQAGKAASKAHGEHVTKVAKAAMDTMKAAGLQVADLPPAEKAKWVNSLPNIVQPWLQATGDNGKADGAGAAARFSEPRGIAVDAAGNVYVADTGNAAVRQITPEGVVTTIAGTAKP